MMRASIAGILSLSFAANVAAQLLNQNQSAPFSLVLLSDNGTINGSALYPCHEGAAIEGLCIENDPGNPASRFPSNLTAFYQFNTTGDDVDTEPPNPGATGILTYSLDVGSFNLSSPMEIATSLTSNVGTPIFTPSSDDYVAIAFDADGRMNIQDYIDDTVYPPGPGGMAYCRWYACMLSFGGYRYQQLAWVIGPGDPQNPTCQKVEVVRVFP